LVNGGKWRSTAVNGIDHDSFAMFSKRGDNTSEKTAQEMSLGNGMRPSSNFVSSTSIVNYKAGIA
jgi:hypothetical protein